MNEPNITKIQSVANVMHQNEKSLDYYAPRVLAIGPIHHALDLKLLRSKQLKIILAAKFITRTENRWQDLLDLITKDIEDNNLIVDFFDEQVISDYVFRWKLKELRISSGDAALICEDLFLLENQVPFQLLHCLMEKMDNVMKEEYCLDVINMFVSKNNIMAPVDSWSQAMNFKVVKLLKRAPIFPIHLLDALRSIIILGDNHDHDKVGESHDRNKGYLSFLGKNFMFSKHMLDMFENMQQDNKMSFRNVKELKLAGIKIKSSDSKNMRSVSFNSRWFGIGGYLSIPPINVDNSTARKLLNLVAYEVCLRDSSTKEACYLVTSYVNLMDLLIDNEEDVKALRKVGVLCHRLSSDYEVAHLFNSLGSNCVFLHNEEDAYIKIKKQIEKHCRKKLPKWTSEFRRNHCNSPWAMSYLFLLVTTYMTLKTFSSTIFSKSTNELLNFNAI
ncbi:hypothetical protein G4B88_004575 [Cannabis sativa]|uniref:Uncharacterized protein n=1 Tax=Cannabis sativa TaxID=3483 RepID=A0A7J6G544_CANSA|nr:hypothetical protein G4B88_004575 [Cannabis sativa]